MMGFKLLNLVAIAAVAMAFGFFTAPVLADEHSHTVSFSSFPSLYIYIYIYMYSIF